MRAAVPTFAPLYVSEVWLVCSAYDVRGHPDVGSVACVQRFRHMRTPKCRKCGSCAALPTPQGPYVSEVWFVCSDSDTHGPPDVGSGARVRRIRHPAGAYLLLAGPAVRAHLLAVDADGVKHAVKRLVVQRVEAHLLADGAQQALAALGAPVGILGNVLLALVA